MAEPECDAVPPASSAEAQAPPTAESTDIADGVERRLDPRYLDLERTICWIVSGTFALVLLAATVVLLVAVDLLLWVWLLLLAAGGLLLSLLVWFPLRWPDLQHRHTSYRVDGLGIEIRQGVVWRRAISVPRSRVQHTDVAQGPLERSLGLGTLLIYTAGTEHAQVSLPGLDHPTALRIRDYLIEGGRDDAV